jgi:hypothetical protein
MKHGLITIAAVVLVGCGPSVGIQQAAREEAGVSADLLPGQGSGVDFICLNRLVFIIYGVGPEKV